MENSKALTNTQLELIKLFNFDLSEKQLNEIRSLLAKYFAEKVDIEFSKFEEENNLSEEIYQNWAKEHFRVSND